MWMWLTYLAVGVIAFAVLHNAWALGNVIWSSKWLRRESGKAFDGCQQSRFVICIPMYEEQDIAEDTLDYFARLDYPSSLCLVCVVTTDRELDSVLGPTTGDVVQNWMRRYSGDRVFRHIHVAADDRCKADQLNAALQHSDSDWVTPDTILGVYDADSRPDRRVLREVDSRATAAPHVAGFQQPALYFSNYSSLPRSLAGFCLRMRPFYNLRFCLYRELPAFARSVGTTVRPTGLLSTLLRSPNHFLGHGEFIRLPVLLKAGGFPPPSADTSLGTTLSFAGDAIAPLATFDVGETPSSIISLYRQGITWYSGCALYPHDWLRSLKNGTAFCIAHILMLFKRWAENMIWCLGPMLFSLALLWTCIAGQVAWLALGIVACAMHYATLLYLAITYSRLRRSIDTRPPLPHVLTWGTVGALAILYPIMLNVACLSPLTYYVLSLRTIVFGSPFPRSKTPRMPRCERPSSPLG